MPALLMLQAGLTIEEVVSEIPHDAATIFTYTLVVLFVSFIWYANRKGTKRS